MRAKDLVIRAAIASLVAIPSFARRFATRPTVLHIKEPSARFACEHNSALRAKQRMLGGS